MASRPLGLPRRVALRLIQTGKPTQNAYVESFNGKFRDNCLNEHWIRSLAEAREIIGAWRADHNQRRSRSARSTVIARCRGRLSHPPLP